MTMTNGDCSFGEYFSGRRLYGDDFSYRQIESWFKDELEGYANLGSKFRDNYRYPYHCMNRHYGFSRLPKDAVFQSAMGLGSAYGDEFLPIIHQIRAITIIEPSSKLTTTKIGTIQPRYACPSVSGTIEFPDESFDLITCFSVLHHIPNVSHVLGELVRVLSPGGYLLIREPILTMGDWRHPRSGLTKHERGIPLSFFNQYTKGKNVMVISKSLCDCAFAYKVFTRLSILKRDTMLYQKIDGLLANLFSWNYTYHRTNLLRKIAPSSIFLVLQKNKL